jgi:LDH2 family malate/lactate/ureidoglycolate dehydrogenase
MQTRLEADMSEKRIEIRKLEEFCAGALTAAGMEASHAAVTAKVLTWTDSFHAPFARRQESI